MSIKNHDTRKVFAINLRQLRKAAKLSQKTAAQMIGLKQNTWSQYESSKSFPEEIVITKIIKILSCTREELFRTSRTYPQIIDENVVNEPRELNSYGAEDKDLLGYMKQLEKANKIDSEVINKLREYILELYKELSDQKDLVIKEKIKLEEFKEMMKKGI